MLKLPEHHRIGQISDGCAGEHMTFFPNEEINNLADFNFGNCISSLRLAHLDVYARRHARNPECNPPF